MQSDRKQQKRYNVSESNAKKPKKNQKNDQFQLDEEVLYDLIQRVDTYSQSMDFSIEQLNQTDKNPLLKYQVLQINGISRQDIKQILMNKIRPIPFTKLNDLRMNLKSALGKIYLARKSKTFKIQAKSLQQLRARPIEQQFNDSIYAYVTMSNLLKQVQLSAPVQQWIYKQYSQIWSQLMTKISPQAGNIEQKKQQKEALNHKKSELLQQKADKLQGEQIKQFRKNMLDIWLHIPHQLLKQHLQKFQIQDLFRQLDENKIIKFLIKLLTDNKIMHACTFYENYWMVKSRYQTNKEKQFCFLIEQNQQIYPYSNNEQSQLSGLIIFQNEVLIPKISKSDHIFAPHVVSLLKVNSMLKSKLLNFEELSPVIGAKVVDLLKQDARNYYRIYIYILRQHYKSIVHSHNSWYIVEDKLSFNPKFIQWFTQDLTLQIEKSINPDILKQLKNIKSLDHLRLSILERNQIINLQDQKYSYIDTQFQRIANPIYLNDRFQCAQIILSEFQKSDNSNKEEISQCSYLRLIDYGLTQKDIKIIDKINDEFYEMAKTLLRQNQIIGFDTQFRCISTKYEQQGVSIIQLSTAQNHYIIDYLKIEKQPKFTQFIIQLLCNQKYIKVGHTISSDIKYLTYTLHIPQQMKIQSFLDVAVMFKTIDPNQKYSSLAFLVQKYLNKKLSKYEQRANWNRRPLKKTQIHYAVLDAFSCVLIYKKMLQDIELKKTGFSLNKLIIKNIKLPEQIKIKYQSNELQQIIFKDQQKTLIQQIKDISIKPIGQFVGQLYRSQNLIYHKKYEQWMSATQPRFLVDNMLKKLSSIMRNCGLDAQYIALRDYNMATQLAIKDNRIILTRDTKFFQRRDNHVPIYLINQKNDSDRMFSEVVQYFKVDLSKFNTLSRCVKCNGPELIIIPKQEAMNQIQFKHQDSKVQTFWRCRKCRQIYWQGGQFVKAQIKYGNLKKSEQ